MKIKALSLKQPWANLVLNGKKTIETRKWGTNYRGDILICSSKSPKIEPFGKALCVVNLYDIEPMQKKHEKKACIEVYPKAMAWHTKDLRVLKKQFELKGRLGLFDFIVPKNSELYFILKNPQDDRGPDR